MQSGQIYTITRIDKLHRPYRYFLKEYDNTAAGWAYKNELKEAPDPQTYEYPFTIQKERVRKGKTEVLPKYLFYPDK